MTTEEKAKAYDEALEKAKVWKEKSGMPKSKQGIIDDIFPELAVSEDEKFRKYILKCCEETIQANDRGLELSMDTTKKLKNWLEKQKSVTCNTIDSNNDEKIRKNCIHFLELQKSHHAGTFEIEECIAWLEKQGKRNPVWSEEDPKRIDYICDFIWKNRKGDTDEIYQQEQDVKWLKSLKQRLV